jgi:hypothetical protein
VELLILVRSEVSHLIELKRDYRYMLYGTKLYAFDSKENKEYVIMKVKDKVYYCPVVFPREVKEHVKKKV